MKAKRQYLIVDTKKYRRHSAPENLDFWFAPRGRQNSPGRNDQCRASVSDFSVLLENHSESDSSLELDTSHWSGDFTPDDTARTTPSDSYQNFPTGDIGRTARSPEDDHRRGLGSWPMWKNILLSQAIAGCMALMDISNASLKHNSCNVTANGQNLPHYILLGLLWTSKLASASGRDIVRVIKYSGLRYLLLSVLHVEANYLLVSSFHHDTYLGNQMIGCVAAVLCAVIAYVCLEVRFRSEHVSGLTMSMVGSVCLCIANAAIRRKHDYEDVLLGDVLRIASGICLAFNSIAQEIIVKSIDFVEYMGMVGLMGSIICGVQAVTLETGKLVPSTSSYWLHLVSYSGAQFLFNSLTPKVLHDMGATGLHLALSASAFYSYFMEVLYRGDKWGSLQLMSFGLTLAGSILFFSKRTVIGTESFFPVKITLTKAT